MISLFDYNFLILSLLMFLPGTVIFLQRKDLRRVISILALCSLPFAFTEFLFYPTYWEPRFLWNLINKIGFGFEDILFVVGLSAYTSTGYAFVFHKQLLPYPKGKFSAFETLLIFFLFCLLSIFLFVSLKIHLIYGAPILMLVFSFFIFFKRRDLILPGFYGAIVTTITYSLLCYILIFIYPNVFELTWHTEKFLNIKILNLPIEELMYASTSGCIATLFYPFVFSYRYASF